MSTINDPCISIEECIRVNCPDCAHPNFRNTDHDPRETSYVTDADELASRAVAVTCRDPKHKELDDEFKSLLSSYRKLNVIARTFRDQHERFHPDSWCAGQSDKHCYACDFGAALRDLQPQNDAKEQR